MAKHSLVMALAAAFLEIGGVHAAQPAAQPAELLFQKLRASVVGIRGTLPAGSVVVGSGVIVDRNEIVSNCHVVQNASNLQVEFSDRATVPALLSAQKNGLDLCLLSARTEARPPVMIAELKDVKIGQAVYAIGNPLALSLTLSDGIVSSIREQDGFNVIQTSAPISPGSSGGGLFAEDGRLIGITTFTYSEGQNLNFAIPGEYVWSATTLTTSATSETATGRPAFTFKGVAFGASIASFREAFPGAACKQGLAPFQHCAVGPVQYLVRGGAVDATFVGGRLWQVDFLWGDSDAAGRVKIAEQAHAKLVELFSPPTEGRFPVPATWKISADESIQLGICNERHWLFCPRGVGAKITLKDDRFASDRGPDRDF